MTASQRLGPAGRIVAATRGATAFLMLLGLVAGVPWALSRYVGWPLPDHLPSPTEVALQLLGPLSTGLLIDVLACVCWVVWMVFTIDVVRCVPDAARAATQGVRLPRVPRPSPTHALAAVLVGAVALSILGPRAPTRHAGSLGAARPVVATATAWPQGAPGVVASVYTLPRSHAKPATSGDAPARSVTRSVVVRAPDPVTGVHDSLWRIAQRTIGDGARWPEIFALNQGKPQPDGGRLNRPSLIFPGEELTLPVAPTGQPEESATPRPDGPASPAPGLPAPAAGRPGPENPPPPVASPQADRTGPGPTAGGDTSVWRPELFTGLGLAAAVSTALVLARRRRRRHYRPGSHDRDDLPVAPVVYQLRLAHLRDVDDQPDVDEPDVDDLDAGTDGLTGTRARPDHSGASPREAAPETDTDPAASARAIAAAAATTHGLGLTGPGSADALRALLLTLLGADTTRSAAKPSLRVLVPRDDLTELLGDDLAVDHLPAALRVFTTLDDALDEIETVTIDRAGRTPVDDAEDPMLVLVARPDQYTRPRIQAVLDNGCALGVAGLLLGQWRPGGSLHVQTDGTVTATSPGPCERLRGTCLFGLDAAGATRIIELLGEATPGPNPAAADTSGDVDLEISAAAPGETEVANPDISSGPPRQPAGADPRDRATEPETGRESAGGAVGVPHPPLRISVLGPPRVLWRPASAPPGQDPTELEITGRLQPRARELLIYLTLHPQGAGRDALAATLWPGSPPGRVTNALNTALTRLRQTLTRLTDGQVTDAVQNTDGRLSLDPAVVLTDYWHFDAAVTARRSATTDAARLSAHQDVVDSYGGELAEGMALEWIEPTREAVRRDAIDSVAALARALFTTHPQRTLDLLEIARAFDPYNELVYRDIMRLQERLGLVDAITRTLALLTARLAETGDAPSADTADLARRLQDRGDRVTADLPAAGDGPPPRYEVRNDVDAGSRDGRGAWAR